jgi:hypothetical protein
VKRSLFAWGFEVDRVKRFTNICRDISHLKVFKRNYNYAPMMRALCCGMYGARPPVPNSSCPYMMILGATKRLLTKVGKIDSVLLSEFSDFVSKNSANFPVCHTLTMDEWLAECKLPLWKKNEIVRAYNEEYLPHKLEIDQCMKEKRYHKIREVKLFGKREPLTDFKPLRDICPTTGAFKGIVAPYFHWLEMWLTRDGNLSQWFVKKIPVLDRPRFIIERLGLLLSLSITCSTDYSSFECSFIHLVMQACEMIVYQHCFGHLPVWDFISSLSGLRTKHNVYGARIRTKYFNLDCDSVRMSGEMNTSLGNSLTNYFLTSFLVMKSSGLNLRGVFEGDDGLFRYEGESLDMTLAPKLGFCLKLNECKMNEASFCGNVFDIVEKVNIADPWYCLAQVGWSFSAVGCTDRVLALLTAAKGFSFIYQYHNSPVLPHLGFRLLRTAMKTLGKNMNEIRDELIAYYTNSQRIDEWERQKMIESLNYTAEIQIHESTRELMSSKFNFPVSLQRHVEYVLDSGEGWFFDNLLIEQFVSASVKQLDGSFVEYKHWVGLFLESEVSEGTPTRSGFIDSGEFDLENVDQLYNIYPRSRLFESNHFDFPFELQCT